MREWLYLPEAAVWERNTERCWRKRISSGTIPPEKVRREKIGRVWAQSIHYSVLEEGARAAYVLAESKRVVIETAARMVGSPPQAAPAQAQPPASTPPPAGGTSTSDPILSSKPSAGQVASSAGGTFSGANPNTGELVDDEPPFRERTQKERDAYHEQQWAWFGLQPESAKVRAEERLALVDAAVALIRTGVSPSKACEDVAASQGVAPKTLWRWWRRVRQEDRRDWLPLLIPLHAGGPSEAQCDPRAWDWLCSHYLTRRRPRWRDAVRRLREVSTERGWVVPSDQTLWRRMRDRVGEDARRLLREGPGAIKNSLPVFSMDPTGLKPGELVSGDGLKFDEFFVRFEDGEVVENSTGWFWADVYSNRILAWRFGKTESVELFRLATYDLTGLCLPEGIQIDNTMTASCNMMTAQAGIRYRNRRSEQPFKGALVRLGIEIDRSNPAETGQPGWKVIERMFGTGGLHEMVASNPRLAGIGHSKANPVDVEVLRDVIAEEVVRFNTRPKRRGLVCAGVKSFQQAWDEAVAIHGLRIATEAQRRWLLLLPELVTVWRNNPQVSLQAGKGPYGSKNTYYHDALCAYKGMKLVGYYDPEDLTQPLALYTLDDRFVCDAERLPGIAYTDSKTAGQARRLKEAVAREKKRTAEKAVRLRKLEVAAMYPKAAVPEEARGAVAVGAFGVAGMPAGPKRLSAVPSEPEDDDDLYQLPEPPRHPSLEEREAEEEADREFYEWVDRLEAQLPRRESDD